MNFNTRVLVSSIIFGFLSSCNGFSSAHDKVINSESCVASNKESNVDIRDNSINSSENKDNKLENAVELKENVMSEENKDTSNKPSNSISLNKIDGETKDKKNKSVEKVTIPCAVLNMPKELSEKPVFYRVNCGDSLSKISDKLLEDACGWDVILNFSDNNKFIGEKGDLIKENDHLLIPQPNHSRFKLYNPQSNETWTSISQKFYGSYVWAPYLVKYNDSWADDKINLYNNCVIKLPSKIYFGDYVLPDSGSGCFPVSYYDQNSFHSLSSFLFGTHEYAEEIAKFNNLPINKVLSPKQLIHIPPSITLKQINNINK